MTFSIEKEIDAELIHMPAAGAEQISHKQKLVCRVKTFKDVTVQLVAQYILSCYSVCPDCVGLLLTMCLCCALLQLIMNLYHNCLAGHHVAFTVLSCCSSCVVRSELFLVIDTVH